MKTLPTQKRALLKRSALLDAARVEFSSHGFEAATAKSITTRAGVAVGTFYQYFDDKNEILRMLASNRMELLAENIDLYQINIVEDKDCSVKKTAYESLFREALMFVYEFHRQEPELHQVLEERRHNDPNLKEILLDGEKILLGRVLRFVQCFNVSDPEVVAANLFAMAEGIVHRHVFGDDETDKTDVVRIGAQMLAAYFQQLDLTSSSYK